MAQTETPNLSKFKGASSKSIDTIGEAEVKTETTGGTTHVEDVSGLTWVGKTGHQEKKVAVYNAAFAIYLKNRPETPLPKLPARPNSTSPSETKSDYARALNASLQTAMQESAVEAKALWEHLFGEKL